VLCFLTKHYKEQFNSHELATLTCLNLVQLRRVVSYLTDQHYITVQRGKVGGYHANERTAQVNLAELYPHFVLDKNNNQKIFTGDSTSNCQISKQIAHTMSHYYTLEHQLILNYYQNKTISDVLYDILREVA